MEVQIRSSDSQHEPGQPRPGTDVDDRLANRYGLVDDRTVEEVPLPQPWYLPRSDQPMGDPTVGQDCREALGQPKTITKDPIGDDRRWRWWRRLTKYPLIVRHGWLRVAAIHG